MEYATLRLSQRNDHTQYFDLKFKLIQNTFTKKWIERVLKAQQNQCPISETWAIYNLNNHLDHNFIKNNLNRLINEVDQEHELFRVQIKDVDDQDALNKIHAIFEETHGQLEQWKNNPIFKNKSKMFRKNLSEINQLVHACENIGGSRRIRVVWFDLPKYKTFTADDYKLFTNTKKFGSLYHMYCDVGKNIEDLSKDNDNHHHDFVPNLHYSADCLIEFNDRDEKTVIELEKKYQDYISNNQDVLGAKGYESDDPRLTTGRIEIARLQTELEQGQILEKLKNYDNIHAFFLS